LCCFSTSVYCYFFIDSVRKLLDSPSYIFATASRPNLEPIQPPIQSVLGVFPRGQSDRGVKLTTHLHLVSRLKMRGAILPLPQYVFMAWCLVKERNFTLFLWGQKQFHCLVCVWKFDNCRPRNSPHLWNPKAHYFFQKNCHWTLFRTSWIQFTLLHTIFLR
jgi:hypothetical protein